MTKYMQDGNFNSSVSLFLCFQAFNKWILKENAEILLKEENAVLAQSITVFEHFLPRKLDNEVFYIK